jgi:hypothetical protein
MHERSRGSNEPCKRAVKAVRASQAVTSPLFVRLIVDPCLVLMHEWC